MQRITIPEGVEFSALRLARDAGGDVSYEAAVLAQICAASRITLADEDSVSGLIVAWYAVHLARGGAPDPVAESIGAEVRAEDGYEGVQ